MHAFELVRAIASLVEGLGGLVPEDRRVVRTERIHDFEQLLARLEASLSLQAAVDHPRTAATTVAAPPAQARVRWAAMVDACSRALWVRCWMPS